MRVALVLNRDSGTLRGLDSAALTAQLEAALTAAGVDVSVTLAGGPEIEAALEAAFTGSFDRVLVGGGDGTIRTAAEIAIRTGVPVGVLPLGTLNLFARALGVPMDPVVAAVALVSGPVGRVDAARLNGKVFLCQAVLGVLPRLSQHREAIRGTAAPYRWWLYAKALVSVLARSRRFRFEIRTDAGVKRVKALTLAISNNLYDEQPGAFLSRASLSDGVLGLYIARHRQAWWLLVLAVRMLLGRWDADSDFTRLAVAEVTVGPKGRNLLVAVDGEAGRIKAPLVFDLLPQALPVALPSLVSDHVIRESEKV